MGVGVVASVEEVNLRVSTIIGGYRLGDNVNLKIYSNVTYAIIWFLATYYAYL